MDFGIGSASGSRKVAQRAEELAPGGDPVAPRRRCRPAGLGKTMNVAHEGIAETIAGYVETVRQSACRQDAGAPGPYR